MTTLLMRHVAFAMLMLLTTAAGPASQPATTTTTAATTRPAGIHEPPVIHRLKAGTPDHDGWHAAKSTGSGFRVATPDSFNDITVSHLEPDGTRVTTHMIAARFGAMSFTATASANSAVKLPPNAVDAYLDMLATSGVARNRHAVKLDGVGCSEVEIAGNGVIARHRVVQRDDVIYVLKVEVRGRELRDAEYRLIDKFFESFRFPAPEADNAPGRTAAAFEP